MEDFNRIIESVIASKALVKIIYSRPKAGENRKITGRIIVLKGTRVLQLEKLTTDNKALHENIPEEDCAARLIALTENFMQINLITTGGNCEALFSKSGKCHINNAIKRALSQSDSGENNRAHKFILDPSESSSFLSKLGVCDEKGNIYDKKRSKFKQINRFVEILDDVYSFLPKEGTLNILDLCCGKSYLTFAVYHYFSAIKKRKVNICGVDLKKDVIDFCNALKDELHFDGMAFYCMNIFDFEPTEKPDLVVSLHACDIATDIVLYNAVRLNAGVILSTPCCHHEMMNQLNCSALSFVGQSMYRQKLCDALTDSLRCKRLEAEGYKVTALELIDPDETPKNILIKAIRANPSSEKKRRALTEYKNAVSFLGVDPYLDRLFEKSLSENTKQCRPTDSIAFSDIPSLRRTDRSNKGTYGTVGVIAGSKNMAGACYFAGFAAYSCGAGLVKIITPECNREIIQKMLPEAVLYTYKDDTPEKDILSALTGCTSVVLGPGLGKSEKAGKIVEAVLGNCTLPLVLDADGLNLSLGKPLIKEYQGILVQTPHMGEASRLLDEPIETIMNDPLTAAEKLLGKYGHTVLLKDAHTIILSKNAAYINKSGNNGMSTGGCGDLLSGIIGALLRGAKTEEDAALAAAYSAYLHGLCGDAAAKKHGKHAMLASHVAEEIGDLLKILSEKGSEL